MDTTPEDKFSEWVIADLFGHTQVAGQLSEITIAGDAMLRLDVPAVVEGQQPYTVLYGTRAFYSIRLVDEAVARAYLLRSRPEPVARYMLPPGLSAPVYDERADRDADCAEVEYVCACECECAEEVEALHETCAECQADRHTWGRGDDDHA